MFVAMSGAEPVPAPPPSRFHESNLWATPIRDLGLTIAGTPLQPIIEEFRDELRGAGITRVRPRFYLSTEWGVPFETIAIAIPFYLARPDLTALHAERVGLELASQLRARVAVDREVARRLRRYLTRATG